MTKRANLRFTYPFVLGLVLGILSAYLWLKGKSVNAVLTDYVILSLFIAIFFPEKKKLFISLLIIFLMFLIGFFYFKGIYEHYLSLKLPSGTYNISGQVESVLQRDKCYVVIKNATVEHGYKLSDVKVRVIISGGAVNVGDNIFFRSKVNFLLTDKIEASSLVNWLLS